MKMYQRIINLDDDDYMIGSSHFGKFLQFFHRKDASWILEINEIRDHEE